MIVAAKPEQDLPVSPLGLTGFTIFTIPKVVGFPWKSCKNSAAKTLEPKGIKALNPIWGETESWAGQLSANNIIIYPIFSWIYYFLPKNKKKAFERGNLEKLETLAIKNKQKFFF